MAARYLIDTDWAIHYLDGHPAITERLLNLSAGGLAVSIISFAELYEGILYPRKANQTEEAFENFKRGVRIVGIDDSVCRIFAQQRGKLRRSATLIDDFDLMIGATALRHGLTLLTNNRRHFERIHGLDVESL
jgi:tRNA(fMet)-specific endonuclease VapC